MRKSFGLKGRLRELYIRLLNQRLRNTEHFAMGLEEIDPHSEIPMHSHSEAEEIIFVFGGKGKAYVGDEVADSETRCCDLPATKC